MEDKSLTLKDLEELMDAIKKIDPNNEVFVKGNEAINAKVKTLKDEEEDFKSREEITR